MLKLNLFQTVIKELILILKIKDLLIENQLNQLKIKVLIQIFYKKRLEKIQYNDVQTA